MQQHTLWILLDSSKTGGIETHVAQLSIALKKHYKVEVIFIKDYGDHPLKDLLKKHQVSYSHLENGFPTLLKRCRRESPNILHTHGYKAGIFGRVAGKLSGVPVVSSFHAGETPKGKLRLYDLIDRYTAFLANQRIAISKEIQQRLVGKSTIIRNFVSLPEQLTNGDQIAFVGRLSEEKGADRILLIAKQLPSLTFHIYGDGPEKEKLIEKAPTNVIFHGNQSNMSTVWPQIGLVLMPSRYEGLPMAALEAMSYGIPVIASPVGELPELLENKRGWICDPNNLLSWIIEIKAFTRMNSTERKTLSHTVRHHIAEHYSADAITPILIDCYNDLLPSQTATQAAQSTQSA